MFGPRVFRPTSPTESKVERYGQFLSQVANTTQVWGLLGPFGWVTVTDPQGECTLPVWPDQQQAAAGAQGELAGLTPVCADVQEFLYLWLPDMEALDVRVDVVPTPGCGGLRVSASRLQQHLREQLLFADESEAEADVTQVPTPHARAAFS